MVESAALASLTHKTQPHVEEILPRQFVFSMLGLPAGEPPEDRLFIEFNYTTSAQIALLAMT